MKIVKRNGTEVEFDRNKIKVAISKANAEVPITKQIDENSLEGIVTTVVSECEKLNRAPHVEEVQDIVEKTIAKFGFYDVLQKYYKYRYIHNVRRRGNAFDDTILSLINLSNEDIKQENSNKNPTIISTQRDYMAGEVSKDLSKRLFLPEDVVQAHEDGLIHVHDLDYFIQNIHNCCLINLEDMLQNGTVISETMIEKPHSFLTACNIATQIVAQVASSQFGGQSITLSHLAPFVESSRQKYRKELKEELAGLGVSDEKINEIAETRVRREIKDGVQTMQYQILTLQTTNGQTPFISVNMYLGEVEDEKTKDDLAMIIEEVLIQRTQGVKNEVGVYVAPAFPKLLYILEEDNIHEDSKYWHLTELASKCVPTRLVPDFISEKKMKEYKIDKNGDGNCYPCIKSCA